MTAQRERGSVCDTVLACVEVGGSGSQTVVFDTDGTARLHDGAFVPGGATLAMAVPGIIEGTTVLGASSLGWYDVDPAAQLGLGVQAELVCNDAEAASLGEWVLAGRPVSPLVYVGVGTGVGGAVVRDGVVVADNLFGHQGGFGTASCLCGRSGCLETVAAGWALPEALSADAAGAAGEAIGQAVAGDRASAEALAEGGVVVVTGGLADAHPSVVAAVAGALPGSTVVASHRPAGAKSAAAWGLRFLLCPAFAAGPAGAGSAGAGSAAPG